MMESENISIEDAKEAYLFVKKDYRISRNVRAQWYFNNLNKICQVKDKLPLEDCSSEVEVISIVPFDGQFCPNKQYRLSPSTKITFLFHQYRIVFCLDLSPSVAAVDIQHGVVLSEEVLPTLAKCLRGLVQPFYVPGSEILFQPHICITILAQAPFVPMKAQQVLVQGWYITRKNLNSFLDNIKRRFVEVKSNIASSMRIANEELKPDKALIDHMKFNSNDSIKPATNIGASHPLVNSLNQDCSLLNILRYGMLALQLLPENSNAGIVVVTDGVLGLPDISLVDSLLTQLQNSSISCSFLQIGSSYHPHSCFGLVPNNNLLSFIANATYGSHFECIPNVPNGENEVNLYHKMCLMWSFKKEVSQTAENDTNQPSSAQWIIKNDGFYCNKDMAMVKKKQCEKILNASLQSILSCRLREGYTLSKVHFTTDGQIEVRLLYSWRPTINIECVLKTKWPLTATNSSCQYEIFVEGNYDFLHDLSPCAKSKPPSSPFRLNLVRKYWTVLQSLNQTDQLLLRLNSFASKATYYTVPESNKNGVPLFFLPANSEPVTCCSESSHHAFSNFWKPMCTLDINIWQKWMHTHRIGILLEHDMPLPKHLHQPSANGRYQVIQCSQALTSLNQFLRTWSSFVLIDNQSYIKLMFREPDKPPISFFIIKVTSKALCMVIRLAFLGGTSGYERNKVVKKLKEEILNLNFPQRAMSKEPSIPKSSQSRMTHCSGDCGRFKVKVYRSPLSRVWSEIKCCVFLHKPVERILIRYERTPSDYQIPTYKMEFGELFRPKYKEPKSNSVVANKAGMLTTLSSYLFHRRWIWGLQNGCQTHVPTQTASRILSTLIKMRLQEGFNFAYSYAGIINMVMELDISPEQTSSSSIPTNTHCIVQYVIFPPHSTTSSIRESASEDDSTFEMEGPESDGELEIITECWIEPQHGFVCKSTPERRYLESLTYNEIPSAIRKVDANCLSSMITFEHLNLICKKKYPAQPPPRLDASENFDPQPQTFDNSTITNIPFKFDLLGLFPKCQQAELLFSTYVQDLERGDNVEDAVSSNDILFQVLLQNLSEVHDAEVELTTLECQKLMEHVVSRPRTCFYKAPFTLDATTIPEVTIRWKCYIKGISSTHVLITLVPASYPNLRKLIFPTGFNAKAPSKSVRFRNLSAQSEAELSSPDSKHFMTIQQRDELDLSQRTTGNKKFEPPDYLNGNTGSLTLPVYVYDCPLRNLVDQALFPMDSIRLRDIHHDYTYKMYGCAERSEYSEADSMSVMGGAKPEHHQHKLDDDHVADKQQLQMQCNSIQTAFAKSFVNGVYSCLKKTYDVDSADLTAIVDGICEENVIEIDITNFLRSICAHVRGFQVQTNLEKSKQNELLINKSGKSEDLNESASVETRKFPLSLLKKHLPCEKLSRLHEDIKADFKIILNENFKEVPCNTEYKFYCPSDSETVDQNESDELMNEDDSASSINNLEDDTTFKSASEDCQSDKEMCCESLPSIESPWSNESDSKFDFSSSRKRHVSELASTASSNQANSPALFICMTCSVRWTTGYDNMPVDTVPTCLGEIVKCLEADCEEIDLNKFSVTLDIICLNLPTDVESGFIQRAKRMRHTTSFCSTSSPAQDPPEAGNYDADGSIASSYGQTILENQSFNGSKGQQQAIQKIVNKTNWMLTDEIASSMLDMFPITSTMLDVVTKHAQETTEAPNCLSVEVPLMFVFGADSSLEKFLPEFKRLTLPDYHLNQQGSYYYLVRDLNPEQQNAHGEYSLVPPLVDLPPKRVSLCSDSDSDAEVRGISKARRARLSSSNDLPIGHSSPKRAVKTRFAQFDTLGESTEETTSPQQTIHNIAPHLADAFLVDSSCDSSSSPPLKVVKCTPQFFKNLSGTAKLFSYDSNSEDGYDGGSSDSETENHWINFFDNQRPRLPKFWLVLEDSKNSVTTHFHTSQRICRQDKTEFENFLKIHERVIYIIRNICKTVNQSLLLQDLNETRKCSNLLVPEENDDIWKGGNEFTFSRYDNEDDMEHKNYLADTMKFKPGAFACDVVYEHSFPLHHRLNTGGVQRSIGMKALIGVLANISVYNRTNMFVYTGNSGSIFYLRLSEKTLYNQVRPLETQICNKAEDESSPIASRCSSRMSLNKRESTDTVDFDADQMDFRPRTASGTSEKEQSYDNLSLSSKTSASNKIRQQAICLTVHGITKADSEIKEVLINLKNKLDDAILDVISTTLERNPSCKLTPDDVAFIQKPYDVPSFTLSFVLPSCALPFLHAVKFYLRQNFGQFLSNIKYTDTRPETHFQGHSNGSLDYSTSKEDVFLYIKPITSGKKGIACLVLSIIDSQGAKKQLNENLKPSLHGYRDVSANLDFDAVTNTCLYEADPKKSKSPGPMALIEIQTWVKGSITEEDLKPKIESSIRHSLWDLFMEYKMLTAPLCEATFPVKTLQYCLSEPTTPLKKGRSGSSNYSSAADNAGNLNLLSSKLKDYSSSISDVANSNASCAISQQISPRNSSNSKHLAVDLESANLRSKEDNEKSRFEGGTSGHLCSLFHTHFIEFMHFGKSLSVPSVKIESFELDSRNSVPMMLNEAKKLINSDLRSSSSVLVFSKAPPDFIKGRDKEVYVPVSSPWSIEMDETRERNMLLPGTKANYIVIARNMNQWHKSMSYSNFNVENQSPHPLKNLHKFLPLLHESRCLTSDQASILRIPRAETVGTGSASSSPAVSSSMSALAHELSLVIPRQQFLLIEVNDTKMTLFMYNWLEDLSTLFLAKFEKLHYWHRARSTILNSLISQKMGLFHNQPHTRETNHAQNDFLNPLRADWLMRYHAPARNPQNKAQSSARMSHNHQAAYSFKESFRNAKPSQPLQKNSFSVFRDPLHQFGHQLAKLRNADRREIDKKLCNVWKERGSSYDFSITDEILKDFKRKSRMFHYCMSPLLILPSWKFQCGIARDHSVPAPAKVTKTRQRNESGISLKSIRKTNVEVKPQVDPLSRTRHRNTSDSEEEWHVALCSSLLHEYAQYLQTLGGFIMVKTQPPSARKQQSTQNREKEYRQDSKDQKNLSLIFPKLYMVKHVLGGLIGMEIGFVKPFFVCRLFGLNCILLQSRCSQNLNSQLTLAFLDECDKSKVLMHLHSFTFDFHLFTIYSYISGRQLLFRSGYHVSSLLDDFSKYYQKSPMFARNRILASSFIVNESTTQGSVLFQYILEHNFNYSMKVLKMRPIEDGKVHELVLVELTTHRVSYKDSNDIDQSEDFDMALIICHDSTSDKLDGQLHSFHLKFYIILTSRKGLYPKLSLEFDKEGTFQVVHTCSRRKSIFDQASVDVAFLAQNVQDLDELLLKDELDKCEVLSGEKGSGNMCKEAVNYLGYFSSEETLMYDILQEQAGEAQKRLKGIVSKAMVHCRRDILWKCLFMDFPKQDSGKRRKEEIHDALLFTLNFTDFSELLDLVGVTPLNKIDSRLDPFFSMHISWYQSLNKVLLNKYSTRHEFTSPDGSMHYIVVIDPKYEESFIMMSINMKLPQAELCLVSRKFHDLETEPYTESSRQESGIFSMIEGFIGVCCYHMWSKLL